MLSVMHNMPAMNAARQNNIVSIDKKKSTEKLSSGFKINRAADDAAGLSISEKMRKQIRGLNQASDNAQDGVSLCQVADGALAEVSEMLNRVAQLSVKAANGTNSASDREAIQKEIREIYKEIDRIGDTTEFNERKIFKGDMNSFLQGYTPSTKSEFFQKMKGFVSSGGFMNEPLAAADLASMNNTSDHGTPNPYVSVHLDFKGYTDAGKSLEDLKGTNFYVNCCTNCCPQQVQFTDEVGISKSGDVISIGLKKDSTTYYTDPAEFATAIVNAGKSPNPDFSAHVEFAEKDGTLYLYDVDNNDWSEASKRLAYFCDVDCDYHGKMDEKTTTIDPNISLHVGADSTDDNKIDMTIGELNTRVLGLSGSNVSTAESATDLIDRVDGANSIVSRMRSKIGAYQNRLEHTIKNLDNVSENTQSAESLIRDTDMAAEMVKFSMANILEQAGTSMLAQINQDRQSILSLLE